ncbi:MAG TPA: hypothetical protein VG866_01465 [Candidatus Paceibacterota bacterium]|nr:hypothetical protein [Candidatus Paceibacterota bacterium]
MRKDKIKAYELRRERKSYSEISRLLKISKSTLTSWFKNEDWSRQIRDELGALQSLSYPKKLAAIQKANKERWSRARQSYRNSAEEEFPKLKNNPLFISGLMLYWGEGDKSQKNSQLRIANSDPMMIRVFNNFLKKILKVSPHKIGMRLLLYPDLKDEVQKNFWSKAAGIPLNQFKKSVVIKDKHPTRRLSYGIGNLYVCSREQKEKVLTWINLYQELLA